MAHQGIRNVRNFWVELAVDGKKERVATGPKDSGGGFIERITIRKDGKVMPVYEIRGRSVIGADGPELVLAIVNLQEGYVVDHLVVSP